MSIVICEIAGFPTLDQPALISHLLPSIPLHGKNCSTMRKWAFSNFALGNEQELRNFSFLDTCGYCFHVERDHRVDETTRKDLNNFQVTEHDKTVLRRIITGMASSTELTDEDSDITVRVELSNAVSHMVLLVSARDVFTGQSRFRSLLTKKKSVLRMDSVQAYIALYNEIVDILSEIRYSNKIHVTKDKVVLVVTEMDKIVGNPVTAKEDIKEVFKRSGVPENFIVFGGKNCTWNEDDLVAHEFGIMELVPEEHYLKRNDFSEHDRVLGNRCTNNGFFGTDPCQHGNTTETVLSYRKILNGLLCVRE